MKIAAIQRIDIDTIRRTGLRRPQLHLNVLSY